MLTTLCRRADYRNDIDRLAVLSLMDCYANDPMGGAEPLSADVRERLCDARLALFVEIGRAFVQHED